MQIPELKTDRLGGVDVPSAEELLAMRESDYILRARDGELTRVPVEKAMLPHDPAINPQSVQCGVRQSPDGVVYVMLQHIVCRSSNGGRSWDSHPAGGRVSSYDIDGDGTFVAVRGPSEGHGSVDMLSSSDEGRSWGKVSELAVPESFDQRYPYRLVRMPDGALLCQVDARNSQREWPDPAASAFLLFRSTDHGRTWDALGATEGLFSEGDMAVLPSGRVLATVRYQRPLRPDDPPGQDERGYKNVFLADSGDQGVSWQNLRQLCTVYGQTYGAPAAVGDGTAVVVHDTRYGPGHPGSRAMVSRDEGQTWEDEVYYLDRTTFTGSYSQSVTVDGDTVLTVAAYSDAGNDWEAVIDHTHLAAIRWRPVRE